MAHHGDSGGSPIVEDQMAECIVIPFPIRQRDNRVYETWLAWAECEVVILGHDMLTTQRHYDWRSAFARGLRPEEAAAEAAERVEMVTC
jgi:hypothetical protein